MCDTPIKSDRGTYYPVGAFLADKPECCGGAEKMKCSGDTFGNFCKNSADFLPDAKIAGIPYTCKQGAVGLFSDIPGKVWFLLSMEME